MKIKSLMGLFLVGGVVCVWPVSGAVESQRPGLQEIAAHTELVVAAIRDLTVESAATIVLQVQAVILASDLQEPQKRARVVSLITYAVVAKGKLAAPMMGLVAAGTPPGWLAVIAATAVVAAGDSSPAVAKAMVTAVAGDAQAAGNCTAACANPASVLTSADLGILRGITLPTTPQVPTKAPPLPTYIQEATKYPGQ